MKKDVIYVDTDDDITTIIDKVRSSVASIVALVPPKRVGVLQSSVNLKLLQRAASTADKRIVLITSDTALTALASGLAIPIAKNLQSKPEIGAVTDEEESEDVSVIDGNDFAGERPSSNSAKTVVAVPKKVATPKNVEDMPVIEEPEIADIDGEPVAAKVAKSPKKGKDSKIPNFGSFRKKLFILSGLGILLVGFFVWAVFFAPQATIAINAKTEIMNISKTLTLKPGAQLDATQGVLPVVSQQVKKTISVDFTPSGQQNVGEKATGTVKIKTDATTILVSGLTVPSGTQIQSSNGLIYTTTQAAVFDKGDASGLSGVTVNVVAAAPGANYNGVSGAASTSASGVSSVTFATSPSGGSDKVVTIVTADDVAKATGKLQAQDANAVKAELTKQFSNDQLVITDAFVIEPGAVTATPAVGQQASSAKLTQEISYTLLGVNKADLKSVYDAYLATQLKDKTSQKVYSSGENSTQFSGFTKVSGGYSVKASTTAQVGPVIDSAKVANDVQGLMIGEVRQTLGNIQGVESVDVTLSPFWVNRVPKDVNRIKVTFVVKDE